MTVPAYTNIAHFRAPYKNAYIAGFGQEAAPPAPADPLLVSDERGYRYMRPEAQTTFMTVMDNFYGVTQSTPMNTKVVQFTAKELELASKSEEARKMLKARSAGEWIRARVKNGDAVFAWRDMVDAVVQGTPIPENVNGLGALASGSPEAKQTAQAGMVVVGGDPDFSLEKPKSKPKTMMAGLGGPMGIALVVALAAGGVYYMTRDKRGRSRQTYTF